MDEEEFWALIATLGGVATADRVTQLEQFLADLPPDGIIGFADRLAEALAGLDTFEHFKQPVIADLGDDGFLCFRCAVVALGRNRYGAIVAEPSLLNAVEAEVGRPLLSAARHAWEASTDLPWLHETPISYETRSNKAKWPAPTPTPASTPTSPPAPSEGESAATVAEAVLQATGKAIRGLFQGLTGSKRSPEEPVESVVPEDLLESLEPVRISWGGNVVPLMRDQERPEFYEGAAADRLNDLVKRVGLPAGVTSISLILQLGNRWHWSHENSISIDGVPELDIWIESPWQELLDWPEQDFADAHAATCAHVMHQVLSERGALTDPLADELTALAASYPSPGLTNPDS